MVHKNDYTCIVYFPDSTPKKWKYVHGLFGFSQFLDRKHPSWTYFNVYDRRQGIYLRRLRRGSFIPNFLPTLIFALGYLFFLTFKNPSLNTPFSSLTNDFNNTATIWTPQFQHIGGFRA